MPGFGPKTEGLPGGCPVMRRVDPLQRREAIGTGADPVMLEVFNKLFMSVADRMGATLANTASSVDIKERLDLSCAFFAAIGDLIANSPHVPVHLGSMRKRAHRPAPECGQDPSRRRPHDEQPHDGGSHYPGVTVITPVFDEAGKDIIFLAASRGHHADIGGRTPVRRPPTAAASKRKAS